MFSSVIDKSNRYKSGKDMEGVNAAYSFQANIDHFSKFFHILSNKSENIYSVT